MLLGHLHPELVRSRDQFLLLQEPQNALAGLLAQLLRLRPKLQSSPSMIQSVTLRNVMKSMNNKFDELTKTLAQSVTRRAALKKFGAGLAGMALACFGLANNGDAQSSCIPSGTSLGRYNDSCKDCCSGTCTWQWGIPLTKGEKKYKIYYCA
jgi:hypothetical protein